MILKNKIVLLVVFSSHCCHLKGSLLKNKDAENNVVITQDSKMDVQQSSRSMTSKLKAAVGVKDRDQNGTNIRRAPVKTLSAIGHDPQLSAYILTKALKSPQVYTLTAIHCLIPILRFDILINSTPITDQHNHPLQGVSFTDLARSLLDAKDRSEDKSFRSQLPSLLLRLSFYETLPSDIIIRLIPLFQAYSKDLRTLRCLFYLCSLHIGRGSAGTPTLIDPSLAARPPDAQTIQAIITEAQRILQSPNTDPAVRRAAAFLLASAGRANEVARREAITAMERLVIAADALASASVGGRGAAIPSSSNWELQHTVFAALRLSATPAASSEISSGCFVGVASPDTAGARHAIAIASELALRDASLVIQEISQNVSVAADVYEAGGGLSVPSSTSQVQGINLSDPFCRLSLARMCAHVVHSDQMASDLGRGGAPFWRMLCMLCTRDPSDLVRLGALQALTGSVPAAADASIRMTKIAGVKEDAMLRQRRVRAWRLLVSQSDMQVTVPGINGSVNGASTTNDNGPLKLILVVGRLLLLALNKPERQARFNVAASTAASLAESCMLSQSAGTSRHMTNPDVDKVMNILVKELGSLIGSPLPSVQRCSCIEGLLYLQAAGYHTSLSPAKLVQAGSTRGGAGAGGGIQDVLLAAVLKCARAKPHDASMFLGYASGVVGIAPSSADLKKVTELWDAAAESGTDGKIAALSAVLQAISGPSPPSTRPPTGAAPSEAVKAAREDAGWVSFVSTAIWWLGEHANVLCDEFVGKKVPPLVTAIDASSSGQGDGNGDEGDRMEDENEDDGATGEPSFAPSPSRQTLNPTPQHHSDNFNDAVLDRHATRNPMLSVIISALHDLVLTATWQLRASAARALATVAVRSGEPFRLRCYGMLASCAAAGGKEDDALGLKTVVEPALSVVDSLYATQARLEELWLRHGGDDLEGWPPEIAESLAKRARVLRSKVENTICTVPRDRYAVLGYKAALVLAHATEEGPAYATFLSQGASEKGGDVSADGTKTGLVATKNREVEDILSFGGSEEMSFKFLAVSGEREDAAARGDRDQQIEKMLMVSSENDNPWSAFATTTAAMATTGATGGRGAEHARAGDTTGTYSGPSNKDSLAVHDHNSDDPFRAADIRDPFFRENNARRVDVHSSTAATAVDRDNDDPFRSMSAAPNGHHHHHAGESGTARVMGRGVMLHTFIADAQNPEEISIFDGDSVEILEESDGWLLIRDPHGGQGLVPTAYVRIETLFDSAPSQLAYLHRGSAAGVVESWGRTASMRSGDNSGWSSPTNLSPSHGTSGALQQQQQQHGKGISLDLSNNEDLLDKFFDGSVVAQGSGRMSPQHTTTPSRSGGNPFSAADASPSASPTPLQQQQLWQQSRSMSSAHHRVASTASSHQRTLSGSSDIYGSMPGTPSRIEGPERTIVAAFVAEMEGELSVSVGDKVKVHSEVGGWARVLKLSDNTGGLIPSWAVTWD